MRFALKLVVTVGVVVLFSRIGRERPRLAGLLATMPITTLLVLLWLYADHPGDFARMKDYALGVVWGIGPSALFFVVAYFCFRRGVALPWTLCAAFAAWLAGAAVHVRLLGGLERVS
jgi:uncharacterized membrane protein (GlpM family)